jgi:hypothetical protein
MKTVNDGFSFAMDIVKAHEEQTTNGTLTKMVIKGVASNTSRDKENHMVTLQGLESIQKAIENGIIDEDGEWSPVPLRSGHREEWEDKLGDIVKAEIDENENLWIVAELDVDSSKARDLYVKVSKGNARGRKPQLGLSVKGKATKYHFGFDAESNARLTFLDHLLIDEVSVTSKPKNPTPYPLAIHKSLLADPEYRSSMEEPMENEDTQNDPIAMAVQKASEAVNATNDAVVEPTPVVEEQNTEVVAAAAEEKVEGRAIPAGYAEHPTTAHEHAEEAVTEEVVTTEPAAEADPLASVIASLETLTASVSQLRSDVESLRAQPVQKAVEDTTTPAVEVPDMESLITLAVTKAMESLGLSTMADEIKVVKSSLEAIENQPFDRSIAVSKAKDTEDQNDPFVRMRKLRESGTDPISAATRVAYNDR